SQGITISRLIRVRYGQVSLPVKLKPRTFYELNDQERAVLMESVGIQDDHPEPRANPSCADSRRAPRRKNQ
ncbi:MAG: 23S rRNA pseudouridine(2605) synthase RluB, partial [Methylococcales bacterium]